MLLDDAPPEVHRLIFSLQPLRDPVAIVPAGGVARLAAGNHDPALFPVVEIGHEPDRVSDNNRLKGKSGRRYRPQECDLIAGTGVGAPVEEEVKWLHRAHRVGKVHMVEASPLPTVHVWPQVVSEKGQRLVECLAQKR